MTPDAHPASGAVRAMRPEDAAAAADLHRTGIHTGFLSSLGREFLRQLYRAAPFCPAGFALVWETEEGGKVLGFIACAESTGGVYKQSLLRGGPFMAFPLLRHLLRPAVLKRILETLRYPAETGPELPPAEVLSIAVAPEARGCGVGKALMGAALAEFARRGIPRVKLAVGADNDVANAFYRRCGFQLVQTREHHGLPMNVYAISPGCPPTDTP